jgi:hydrogenase maturation protein HypF
MELEALAGRQGAQPLPFPMAREQGGTWLLDPVPLLVALGERRAAGVAVTELAARFHESVAAAADALAARIAAEAGTNTVALGGGCFQNALLTESLLRDLTPDFDVALPRAVPPGDGGIAFGQAVVANAVLQKGGHSCAWESPVASSTSTT